MQHARSTAISRPDTSKMQGLERNRLRPGVRAKLSCTKNATLRARRVAGRNRPAASYIKGNWQARP